MTDRTTHRIWAVAPALQFPRATGTLTYTLAGVGLLLNDGLRECFFDCFYWISQPELKSAFQDLITKYSEPHRHYHTTQHLAECFRELSKVRRLLERPHCVRWALWFHDIIYKPGFLNNEFASAAYFEHRAFEWGLPADDVELAKKFILATLEHEPLTGSADELFVLDIDLWVLGSSFERFTQYESQIRAEFFTLDEKTYAAGRRTVLEGFLARPRIYRTDFFSLVYEWQARENIARLLEIYEEPLDSWLMSLPQPASSSFEAGPFA